MKKNCLKCGIEIDENYKICPACGSPTDPLDFHLVQQQKKKQKKIKLAILIIVGALMVIGFISSLLGEKANEEGMRDSTEKWSKYYEDNEFEIIEVDEDILYENADAYNNKLILTAVKIEKIDSLSLKSNSKVDKSWTYSFSFNFDDKDELKNFKRNIEVVIVGTVDKKSLKTVSVNNCHIIKYGEDAKTKKEELSNKKDEQLETIRKAREAEEIQEKEQEKIKKEEYIQKCDKINYKDIQRKPDSYDGKQIYASGKVVQVSEGYSNTVTLRVKDNNGDIWYITYKYKDEDLKIIENDNVSIYGKSTGTTSYVSVLGSTITIPSISAEYIIIN